jgi:hypothetical protein
MVKNKIIHLPKIDGAMGTSRDAYIKAMLGPNRPKHPTDFVETFIDERKKQLMKEKKHEK